MFDTEVLLEHPVQQFGGAIPFSVESTVQNRILRNGSLLLVVE